MYMELVVETLALIAVSCAVAAFFYGVEVAPILARMVARKARFSKANAGKQVRFW